MDNGRLYGRGIKFPPRVGPDGRVAWSEGEDIVREAIQIILKTNPRERVRLPGFGGGLDQFLFEPNTVTTRQLIQDRMTTALGQWEPRIAVESIRVEPDEPDPRAIGPTAARVADPREAVATITYKLVATQRRERVSVGVALGG